MFKFALVIGGIVGAVVATLLQEPKAEPVLDTEADGLVDKVKSQVREAQIAARAEMQAKEAEMLADYEASRHGPTLKP